MTQGQLLQIPPAFCQYAGGACEEDLSQLDQREGFFLFGSKPAPIAATIEDAAKRLNAVGSARWGSWKDLDVGGRIIFCEICKGIRGSATVFADVTTLNFNLLFEIGYCIGLGLDVRPIRDKSFISDEKVFRELGVLESLGYINFTNVDELVEGVQSPSQVKGQTAKKTYLDSPVYLVKGPTDTEGTVRLLSTLKKSPLHFRVHDPKETPRVPLFHHLKQVRGSFGVIANLLSPSRKAALAHNSLCALLAGVAVAEGKAVLMLQEQDSLDELLEQPLDYRDIVQPWDAPDQIPGLVSPLIGRVIELMQSRAPASTLRPDGVLDRLDLGAPAAENEIGGLQSYFVPTGQSRRAAQGHARLVVGRKGSGKTAIFYGVRSAVQRGRETLVLDMRPEGHQFTRLREAILEELSAGAQEYTIEALWTYLLSAELAHKILNHEGEYRAAQRDPGRFELYSALEAAYHAHNLGSADDLSQRLLTQIDRLVERFGTAGPVTNRTDLAELVYAGDIKTLNDAVASYVSSEKTEVWLLIDNLDKSWATRGATDEDLLILRGLLESSRKLEDQLAKRGVTLRCLVFIRTDVLEHLNRTTPDRGKETIVNVDWDDPELFKEIVRQRIIASTELEGDFDAVWRALAEPAIGVEDSFNYMVERTLMRPRDLLTFLQEAVQVAINRSHQRITADDIRHAESAYSDDSLVALCYEVEDTQPGLGDAILGFQGYDPSLGREAVEEVIRTAGITGRSMDDVIELLHWFGFLGVRIGSGEEMYSHSVHFNIKRLTQPIASGTGEYVVHPTFRAALAMA